MRSKYQIRYAKRTDVENMCVVLCASIQELCAADHKDDAKTISAWCRNKTPKFVSSWLEDPEIELFVAAINQEITAVGALNIAGEITLNYVAPAHQFSGLSTALLAHLEKTLIKKGVSEARLTSTATAHTFYLKRGWRDHGTPSTGGNVTGYPMVKTLLPQ